MVGRIKKELTTRPALQPLIEKVKAGKALGPWDFSDGLVWYKHKIFLPPDSELTRTIISFVHDSCHEGYLKTLYRITRDFFWPHMRAQVKTFVAECGVCQRNKQKI